MTEIINEFLRTAVHKHGEADHDHDHDHDDHDDETTSPVVAKAVAMGILFLTSFILGCLPIKLSKWFKWDANPKGNKVVQMLLCFGGGVLLCTTFLHLLPEVSEHVAELQEQGHIGNMRMHFAEFLMCVGFFTMFFVEELVHYYLHQREKSVTMGALRRSLSIRRGDHTVSTTELVKNMEETKSNPLSFQSSTTTINGELNHNHTQHNQHNQHNGNGHAHHHHHHASEHAGHSHMILDAEDSIVKSIRGLLVVLALSIHELFEGLAVGLESSASNVWYMFGAVSAHKLVIAFCIGVELVSTKTRTLLIMIYVFTFAVVSPMGIGIGIGISDAENVSTTIASVILQGLASGTLLYVVFFEILQSDRKGGIKQFFSILTGFILMLTATILGIGTGIALSETGTSEIDVTSVVLQGMAAGTLLYVVFFEVLARERSNSHAGIWQLLAIIVGFSVMFGLQIITGHEHSHGGGEHSHGEESATASTILSGAGVDHTNLY